MQRQAASLLARAAAAQAGTSTSGAAAGPRAMAMHSGAFAFFTGAGDAAVPVAPAGSSAVRVSAKASADGKSLSVEVKTAGAAGASCRASYPPASLRRLADAPLELAETPRASVLHAGLLDALMRQAHARFAVLSQWPDFSKMLGRDDYYYRGHPRDVARLHELADGYHASYEAVADSAGLSDVAAALVPEVRRRRMGSLGPAVGPTAGNAAVARWFLGRAG